MAPAGQLWSTVEDLARFAAFLALGHPHVLADETLAEMRQPVPPAVEYGLGIRLLPYADGVLVGHTGSMPGFQATLFADPLNHVGVVALTNATTGFSGAELALALLAEHTPGPDAARGCRPTTRARTGRPSCSATGTGATPPTRCAGTTSGWSGATSRAAVPSPSSSDLDGDRIVGLAGYHHGETLHVVRRDDGSVDHLECATLRLHPRAATPTGR